HGAVHVAVHFVVLIESGDQIAPVVLVVEGTAGQSDNDGLIDVVVDVVVEIRLFQIQDGALVLIQGEGVQSIQIGGVYMPGGGAAVLGPHHKGVLVVHLNLSALHAIFRVSLNSGAVQAFHSDESIQGLLVGSAAAAAQVPVVAGQHDIQLMLVVVHVHRVN